MQLTAVRYQAYFTISVTFNFKGKASKAMGKQKVNKNPKTDSNSVKQ